jgi:hypothetical protein
MTTKQLHEALMKEFRKYFEENQDWETTESHASGIRLRRHLYEIRRIALEMRVEIIEIRKLKPKIKSPKYREALLKEQLAQKQQAQEDSGTN